MITPPAAPARSPMVPSAARFEEGTRTIRSVPGNHWLVTVDSWDGAIAHDATARAMAAGLGILHRVAALDAAPIVDQLEAVQALVAEARAVLDAR